MEYSALELFSCQPLWKTVRLGHNLSKNATNRSGTKERNLGDFAVGAWAVVVVGTVCNGNVV